MSVRRWQNILAADLASLLEGESFCDKVYIKVNLYGRCISYLNIQKETAIVYLEGIKGEVAYRRDYRDNSIDLDSKKKLT